MMEFKKGDRIAWDSCRRLVTGTVKYVSGHLAGIERDDGQPGTGHRGAYTVELARLRLIEADTKLREPFYLFAMELVREGSDVEDAIEMARKLQEASK